MRRKHIPKEVPLWRELVEDATAYTECGRRIRPGTVLIPREDAAKFGITKQTSVDPRSDYCKSCFRNYAAHRGEDWAAAVVKLLVRENAAKSRAQLLLEFGALSALAAEQPERFRALIRQEQAMAALRGPGG